MSRGRPRSTPLPQVHNRLREVREAHQPKMSIARLSSLTQPHVPASTIQRHESGAAVDVRYLEIYAKALGCTTDELLPKSNVLNARERALLGLFKQMNSDDQARLIALGHALAEQAQPFEGETKRGAR